MKFPISTCMLGLLWGLSACSELSPVVVGSDPLTAEEHQTLGDAYLAHGEKIPAITQYEAALNRNPRFAPALLALGNIAFEEGSWKKSESFFRRALKVAPDNAAAANNLAMVFLAQGKHLDEARRLIDRSLPMSGSLKPYLLDTSANIALREGNTAEAQELLDEANTTAPPDDVTFQEHLEESRRKLAELVGD